MEILICLITGLVAGAGIGMSGVSAAAIVSPMLITFLSIPAYTAIGIGLSSDVLASAVSAYSYGKNRNIDLKNGIIMLITVLIFTFVGSYVSSLLPNSVMGGFSMYITLIVGLKFIFQPVMTTEEVRAKKSEKTKIIQSIVCGMSIGFSCGFVGLGGGMMLLLVLTSILGYELKSAVGTSVFVMAFTALIGAGSHFKIGGMPDIKILLLCILFTFIGAQFSSKFANKLSVKDLNKVMGILLTVIAVIMILVNFLYK